MTTDKWPNERLDDLATQVRLVASLTTQVATHHAEISGHDDDIRALRQAQAEAIAKTERMLETIGQTCERHTSVVRQEVREQAVEIRKLTAAQRWTPAQWSAILGPTLVALIGAVALILTKGTP